MSLTLVAFLGILGTLVILAFVRNPVFGLLGYLWVYFADPYTSWWGEALPDWRWSLLAAAVALVSASRSRTPASWPPWYSSWASRLLVAFVGWIWLQSLWAVNPVLHEAGAVLFSKYLVLLFLIRRVIVNVSRFETFAWAHVAGCFMLGWEGFRSNVSGRLESLGGALGDDANTVGMLLATGLAFAGLMFVEMRGWRRWTVLAVIPFILNGIILTASRSAFLAMLAGGLAALWLIPRARRRFAWLTVTLAIPLLLILSHEIFWARVGTLLESDTSKLDTSALSRLELLRVGWRMAQDYPLGAGHRGFEVLSPGYVSAEFLTESGLRAAHNTFIAVLVDHGVPGITLYVMAHVWAFVTLWRLRRLDPVGLDSRLGTYRAAVGAALAIYLVAGLFLNLLKAEVGIWMIALLAVLPHICKDSLEQRQTSRRAMPQQPLEDARSVLRA